MRHKVKCLVGIIVLIISVCAIPVLAAESSPTNTVFIPSNMFFPLIPSVVVVSGISEAPADNSISQKIIMIYGEITILRPSSKD